MPSPKKGARVFVIKSSFSTVSGDVGLCLGKKFPPLDEVLGTGVKGGVGCIIFPTHLWKLATLQIISSLRKFIDAKL